MTYLAENVRALAGCFSSQHVEFPMEPRRRRHILAWIRWRRATDGVIEPENLLDAATTSDLATEIQQLNGRQANERWNQLTRASQIEWLERCGAFDTNP